MALRRFTPHRGRSAALAVCALALPFGLAACGDDDEGGEGGEGGGDVTLQLAHSYTEEQPQHRCGAQVIADEVEKADVGRHRRDLPGQPARWRRRPDRVGGLG